MQSPRPGPGTAERGQRPPGLPAAPLVTHQNRDKGRGEAAAAAQQQAGLPGERAPLQPSVCPSSVPRQTNGSAK